MFCSNCGNKLAEDAKFCSNCGARVAKPEEQSFRTISDIRFEEPEASFDIPVQEPVVLEEVAKPSPSSGREHLVFDWSNVVDEPHKKEVREVKSPWDEKSGADEKALYDEMTPSTDKSRTMSFIDVLRAEKEEKEKAAADKAIKYTEVLDLGPELAAFDEKPKLRYAPLYDDVDEPVKTPYDEPARKRPEPVLTDEPRFEKHGAEAEIKSPASAMNIPSFELPDFLKKGSEKMEEPVYEAPKYEAPKIEETVEEPVFEEPRYEDYNDSFDFLDEDDNTATASEDLYIGLEQEKEPAGIDEGELFKEMEESSPKHSGMTIAEPADTESEIEALKRRLAELTGVPADGSAAVSEPAAKSEPVPRPEPAVNTEPAPAVKPTARSERSAMFEFSMAPQPVAETEQEKPLFSFEPITMPEMNDLFDGLIPATELADLEYVPESNEEKSMAVAEEAPFEDIPAEEEAPAVVKIIEEEPAPAAEDIIFDVPTDEVRIEEPALAAEDIIFDVPTDEVRIEEPAPAAEDIIFDVPTDEVRITEPAPVAADVTEPAPAAVETAEPAPVAADVTEPAPAAVETAEPVPVAADVTEPAPAAVETAEPVPVVEDIAEPAPRETVEVPSDALSLEELERDLFGEVPEGTVENEETKKIDKFYTLYKKNEEFQRLLDEEYEKLKSGGAEPEEPKPETPEPVAEISAENSKAYRPVEDETIYMPKEEVIKQIAQEVSPVSAAAPAPAPAPVGPIEIKTGTVPASGNVFEIKNDVQAPAPIEIDSGSASYEKQGRKASKKADKKAAKEAAKAEKARKKTEKRVFTSDDELEYEDVDSGNKALTILAVVIAFILVVLLAVILILQVWPDSSVAAWIDTLIENITSSIGAVSPYDGQYLV